MRGRKPKPTALKLVQGVPGKRPLPKREPSPEIGAPACPEWLLPEAKKVWRRLVRELEALGLLTGIDREALAGYCQAWANAVDWQTGELGAKTILLKNTHATASLRYRLLGYAAEGGIDNELVPETTLSPGEVAEFHYDRQWHRLVVPVRDGSGTATYRIDYEGQGA